MVRRFALGTVLCVPWFGHTLLSGQTASGASGTLRGSVLDPSQAAIPGATVEIANPVAHFRQQAQTDAQGRFLFANLPFHSYHLTASAPAFQTHEQDLDVRSAVPVEVKITLEVGAAKTALTISAEGQDLVETDATTHTDIDRGLLDKLPVESQSSSLSSLLTLASPGIAADSDGMMHGLGDHAGNSFSLDGQPITDQQSKAFSNQLPVASVQSIEVIEGAPSAEYGDKTSMVVVVTTRSGLGVKPAHGGVTTSYGTFGTVNGALNLSYGTQTWGNFVSADAMTTGRFLDGPEFQVMHSHGNMQDLFDRLDYKSPRDDSVNLNFGLTRSWFQTPNSFDAQNATAWSGLVVNQGGLGPNGLPVGSQDQRSRIETFNVAPAWTRVLNANSVFTAGVYLRQDRYTYDPSRIPFADLTPNLQRETIGQNRRLTNAGLRAKLSYEKGIHSFKAGVTYWHTFLRENDSLGIVDPTLNAVCLNADGSPNTNPALTSPAQCTGTLQPNPAFVPILGCYDLTRTAVLPASDGCPQPTSTTYLFRGTADIKELGLYVEDTIKKNNWTFNLGLRGDVYRGITSGDQTEPRLGAAYNFRKTNTVIRTSYARTLETPFNENLIISSTGCFDPVINALAGLTQGYPCITRPLSPGWRNEFHVGLSQAFGRYVVLDGEYIWKYTHSAFDFSALANTPITFPIEWTRSKITGPAVRASMPSLHGLTAYIVLSHVTARFFPPQVSGIGITPTATGDFGVFRIDHDEVFNQTTHLQYQPWKDGPWLGFNWRYDSGMVAGPVPCAGGSCNNGPNGSEVVVDVSNLSPDQQFQGGLFCGATRATPTTPISLNGLCPASLYGSTLLSIPSAGTANPDHNPPRIAQRNLFDVALGYDNVFHGDKQKWNVRITVLNLANQYALYNFLSTFSGTHYVSPRTVTAEIGWQF
ncbi:MAG TPA: TonB-dependent receptor [Bryobacteraceae bacterium]|nr:TonB-dependent receptor [Bryobacteraceae bacterium]